MPVFSDATAFRIFDSVAIVMSQAYQLARTRVAACASPVLRLMAQRDHVSWETQLLRRELEILRGQRENLPAHRRPGYSPNYLPQHSALYCASSRHLSGALARSKTCSWPVLEPGDRFGSWSIVRTRPSGRLEHHPGIR